MPDQTDDPAQKSVDPAAAGGQAADVPADDQKPVDPADAGGQAANVPVEEEKPAEAPAPEMPEEKKDDQVPAV